MALTFVGLLYMQFVYMEEMVKMREQHFSEGVKRSLYSLSTALEKNETKNYLEEVVVVGEHREVVVERQSDFWNVGVVHDFVQRLEVVNFAHAEKEAHIVG